MPKKIKCLTLIFENCEATPIKGVDIASIEVSGFKKTGFTWMRNRRPITQASCNYCNIVFRSRALRKYALYRKQLNKTLLHRIDSCHDLVAVCIGLDDGSLLRLTIPGYRAEVANCYQRVSYMGGAVSIRVGLEKHCPL